MQDFLNITALCGCLLLINGCALERTEHQIDASSRLIEKKMMTATTPPSHSRSASLEIVDHSWLGNKALILKNGQPLPACHETPHAVSVHTALPQNLYQLAEIISHDLGVPVRLDNLELPNKTTMRAEGFDALQWTIPVNFKGTLSGFLNMIAAHFNVAWSYDGAEVHIYRFATKTFTIESLPGVQSMVDGLAGSTVGESKGSDMAGSASNDATQKAELSITLEFWSELSKTLETMLGGEGMVSISPSSGTVTVMTSPDKMQTVTQYLREENKRLSKQAAITVEIWSVSLSDGESYGLDLKALFKERQGLTYTLQGAKTIAVDNPGSLAVSILNPTPNTSLKRFDGSQAAFEALSSLGKVTRLARIPVTALNNRPATRKIAIDTAYLESITTTVSKDSPTQTSLNPGMISSGIIVQLLPRILDDGRIILQYSLNLSELINLRVFGADDKQIQLPEQTKRLFVQQSALKNGSTLILSGFEQDHYSLNAQGLGSAWNLLMGGAKSSHQKEMIVIAITPYLLSMDDTAIREEP